MSTERGQPHPEQEAEKVDGRLTGSNFVSLKQGQLNEANTTIMWGEDSGARSNETNPFLVDVPDVGMVSITDTGNGENTAYAGPAPSKGNSFWTSGRLASVDDLLNLPDARDSPRGRTTGAV